MRNPSSSSKIWMARWAVVIRLLLIPIAASAQSDPDRSERSKSLPTHHDIAMAGEIIDIYKILQKIGQASAVEIYSAEHINLGVPRAVMLLRRELLNDPAWRSSFKKGARFLSILGHHPNIIIPESFGRLPDGRLYVSMEELQGQLLSEYLTHAQPPDVVLDLLIQTGRGIAAAHEENVLFRNLTPESIFVTRSSSGDRLAKLIDFSRAIEIRRPDADNRLPRNFAASGVTPAYMPPELIRGAPVDERADVYAMGVLAYLAFTGDLPFAGDTVESIRQEHARDALVPPSQRARQNGRSFPLGLEPIILRAMAKTPDQRYASMDAMVHAMHTLHESLVAGPTKKLDR